jgi:hypothetical protein
MPQYVRDIGVPNTENIQIAYNNKIEMLTKLEQVQRPLRTDYEVSSFVISAFALIASPDFCHIPV